MQTHLKKRFRQCICPLNYARKIAKNWLSFDTASHISYNLRRLQDFSLYLSIQIFIFCSYMLYPL